jgi:nucleoside-diphosphate-sugar epimerase
VKKLLLCGHGYLGQAISREFLAAGWHVTAISRHGDVSTPNSEFRIPNFQPLPCDLTSPIDLVLLAARIGTPDLILHCAASGRGGSEAYRGVYFNGCRYLLEAFPGTPLIFTSSTSVYAQTDGSEVTEESPAEPDRETGKILRETEDLVLAHGGLVARLAGIYGPGRSVILKKFLTGEAILEEDGRRFLNQIHRDDAARALFHLSSSQLSTLSFGPSQLPASPRLNRVAFAPAGFNSQLYNVSDSHPLTQFECYTGLADLFARPLPPSGPRDLNRKRGWTHKRVSNAKLRTTGWHPEFPSFLNASPAIAPTL